MMRVHVLGLILLLVISNAVTVKAQGSGHLLDRIVRTVERIEPQWSFIPAVCTCPALVPGQTSYEAGGWHIEDETGRFTKSVSIYISHTPSDQEAARWMEGMSQWEVGEGRHRETYSLGDETYLSRNQDGSSTNICFRMGNIVAEVSGELGDVERFARYAEEVVLAR